jgi:para-nitrobenzyl esterase
MRLKHPALALAACWFPLASFDGASAAQRPIVTIAQGRLAGTREGPLRVFRGIPFALPPVGERRWRPPAPPGSWDNVRDATAFGPSCLQPPVPADSVYFDPPATMSEDCLTLNVWAPADATGAPVIVWIHGGSLRIGGSAEPLFDGAALARRGIVFVSINYRLGIFGWLAHPELSAESPHRVSGNYGLLDQVEALRWVRTNIAAFGGDPGNVTIMGESAGALSVAYHLVSPLARGLFHKAIAQSVNIRAFPELRRTAFGLEPAEETGRAFAARAGASDLAALRSAPAEGLLRAALAARFPAQGTIDGWALPEQIVESLDAGRQARVPLLAGFNSGELRSQRGFLPPAPPDAATYEAEIQRRSGDLAPAFLRLYPASDIDGSMLATLRDAIYGWATERIVRGQAAAGQGAFLYLFDHCDAAARVRNLCAFHASELPYVFGLVRPDAALPPNWPRPAGPDEAALSEAIIDYWVSFARTGSPNGPGRPHWRPYSDREAYMRFAGRPIPSTDLLPGMFELHETSVGARRRAGTQWFLDVGVSAPTIPSSASPISASSPRRTLVFRW